jgi:tryptophanyl-tRNA synthetase
MGELSRMTQYKEKSLKAGESIPVGLFTYPLLMASDILLYQTDLVPVGADQKQHLELTRDLALRFNALYGNVFKVPDPYISQAGGKIMDLQDPTIKMSKSTSSELGAVFLSDSPKEIEKKLKRAVTDSGTLVAYSGDQPGLKNLIDIQSVITGKSVPDIVAGYAGKMYGHVKVDTAEIIISELAPLQKRTQEYLADRGELYRVLRKGADAAASTAEITLRRTYEAIGLI